ncbi:MAG TPA: formate/nitrite transporter family protein [Gemmatimonadaceae bacterium]
MTDNARTPPEIGDARTPPKVGGAADTESGAGSGDSLQEKTKRGSSPAQEDRDARERREVSANVVHEAIRFEGEDQLNRSAWALFWSGLAAGLTMGFSLVGSGVLRAALPDTPWRFLIESLGYTVGFIFVVAGRQQLFTENTLTPVLPVFRRISRLPDLARLWVIVLIANLIGVLIFAWAAALTPIFQPEVKRAFAELAHQALEPVAGTLLMRAIIAGWLIALMVWLMPAAEHSRLAMIVLTTYLIAVTHMAHSIAGSAEVLFLVFTGGAGWSDYARFVSITVLGNVIGGVTIVALLNHGQVIADEDD